MAQAGAFSLDGAIDKYRDAAIRAGAQQDEHGVVGIIPGEVINVCNNSLNMKLATFRILRILRSTVYTRSKHGNARKVSNSGPERVG
jgi:hypothetical protein